MGKNRRFEIVYEVRIKGKTTNGTASKNIDQVFEVMIKAMEMTYRLDIEAEVIKSKGDYNAFTKEVAED